MTASKSDLYSFTHNGKTHTFEKSFDLVRAPKWVRANRRRDELDLLWTILEEIGGEDVVEVLEEMGPEEFNAFSKKVMKEMSAAFQ